MASGLCIGIMVLNALILASAMGARSAIHRAGAVPSDWMAVTIACANLIAAPVIAFSVCCIKEGREALAILISAFMFAVWGSGTLGLFEYVLRSDYQFPEYRGQAAGLLLIPTIFLILIGFGCWFLCDCVCCEPDVETVPPVARYHPPEKIFSASRWMRPSRSAYSSLAGRNSAGRTRS